MRITTQAYQAILTQAREQLPCEACGYLLGTGDTLSVNYPMTNGDHSSDHFSFLPAEQFAAMRHARNEGLHILANWHSHPSSPSRPSAEDIRLANDPRIAYLILSLAQTEPVLNAFSIRKGIVERLPLHILD